MKTLAILGIGPRGLYALERLLQDLETSHKEVNILLLEPSQFPGSGAVWHPSQPDSNWTNITERALLELHERPKMRFCGITIDDFPSYHRWSHFNQKNDAPDTFPPRHKIGTYLNERFQSIYNALISCQNLKLIEEKASSVIFENEQFYVKTKTSSFACDAVLLTIGHQPTKLSKQLITWKKHAKVEDNCLVFENPYPVSQFENIKNKEHLSIGLRGLGLAMIDVMRALVINDFGNFKITDPSTFETMYYKSKEQDLKLIPFSLDGLPLAPKPLNKTIDDWYKPTAKELEQFKTEIASISQGKSDVDTVNFLIRPMATIVSRVFMDLNEKAIAHNLDKKFLKTIISIWIKNHDFKHELIQNQDINCYKLIETYIQMALGKVPISLDFCIGQVWRHCQPTLYDVFSHSILKDELIEKVIELDENSKRYSYGPPIESMQQVLALVDANIMSLDFVNDPKIELVEKGWNLTNETKKNVQTSVMINSVLDAPKLLEVNSNLIKELLNDDLIKPIHSKLGIETTADGYVKTPKNRKDVSIAVLGRLTKGSVIGVDAILECFGDRVRDWSKAYVKRLN